MTLILASQSQARRAMLTAAGISHQAMAAGVDEESAKEALRHDGLDARSLADALAELKARKLSGKYLTDLVLGCDQTLALADGAMLDGAMLDKAASREELREQLSQLRGTTHKLYSAAVVCQGGAPIWRQIESAKLTMRDFSDAFLDSYLDTEWPEIAGCVGGYRLEGLGVQLFSKIEGNHFTILGLPLLPLLGWLRDQKEIPA